MKAVSDFSLCYEVVSLCFLARWCYVTVSPAGPVISVRRTWTPARTARASLAWPVLMRIPHP